MPHPNIEFVLAQARDYVKRNEVRYGDKVAYNERALMVKNLLEHIEALAVTNGQSGDAA